MLKKHRIYGVKVTFTKGVDFIAFDLLDTAERGALLAVVEEMESTAADDELNLLGNVRDVISALTTLPLPSIPGVPVLGDCTLAGIKIATVSVSFKPVYSWTNRKPRGPNKVKVDPVADSVENIVPSRKLPEAPFASKGK